MADATLGPVPISAPKLVAPPPFMVQPALAPVPAPVALQAMTSAAPMTKAPSASLPQSSTPNVDLDLDVDQAVINELRDKTVTEVFTLKQDNAKATSAYMWTMRSHAFE